MNAEAPKPAPKRNLRQRMLDHILHPELSPEQVAWSFALGFCIAWNPLLGTHTWLVIGLCVAFRRLHRPLIVLAMLINNPWTMVPMATLSAYAGNLLMGHGLHIDMGGVVWNSIGWRSFATREGFQAMMTMLRPVLIPYLLGGAALSLLALPSGYYFMRWLTLRLRKIHWKDLPHPHLPHLHLVHHEVEPAQAPAQTGEGESKTEKA
jgi:uncharacterized protein (DUF2062 family)